VFGRKWWPPQKKKKTGEGIERRTDRPRTGVSKVAGMVERWRTCRDLRRNRGKQKGGCGGKSAKTK